MATTFADTLRAYDASRAPGTDLSVACHAPFLSLNFDQTGRVTACCYNRDYVLGTYPGQSLHDIWTGPQARALRTAFLEGTTAPGCDVCFDQLRSRNFSGVLMRNFDRFSVGQPSARQGLVKLPMVLEFEISNTCSLECVMCGGHWSSAIRERREHLPPLHNPYDAAFVDQIEELLPSVVFARFLGGEPFLITRYIEIWDRMRRVNPDAEISITTSAAVVPARPRLLLEDLRAHIVVSLDSVVRETYEAIRRNARFDQVMANLEDLHDYTRRKGTSLSIACCPMPENWRGLGAVVEFCEARQLEIFFNTVRFPVTSSLANLPERDLVEAIAHLETEGRSAAHWSPRSRAQWAGLLSQLRTWLDNKRGFLRFLQGVRSLGSQPTSERAGESLPSMTAALDAARDELARDGASGKSTTACEQTARYFQCLLAAHVTGEWYYDADLIRRIQDDTGTIANAADLAIALDVLHRFHVRLAPTDDTLRRRLEAVRAVSSSPIDPAAVLELGDTGMRGIYWFVTEAPERDFAQWIGTFHPTA